MCEQAETFCRVTLTGFAHLAHLKVRKRAGFMVVLDRCWNKGRIVPEGRAAECAEPVEGPVHATTCSGGQQRLHRAQADVRILQG